MAHPAMSDSLFNDPKQGIAPGVMIGTLVSKLADNTRKIVDQFEELFPGDQKNTNTNPASSVCSVPPPSSRAGITLLWFGVKG